VLRLARPGDTTPTVGGQFAVTLANDLGAGERSIDQTRLAKHSNIALRQLGIISNGLMERNKREQWSWCRFSE